MAEVTELRSSLQLQKLKIKDFKVFFEFIFTLECEQVSCLYKMIKALKNLSLEKYT